MWNRSRYGLSASVIKSDLTVNRPQWLLSAYAPVSNAPALLFGGYPREQSYEEMRLRHLEAAAAGRSQQAVRADSPSSFGLVLL